jgi:hypothetical protein
MTQRLIIFLMAALVAYACATSKKVADISVGTWDYVVKNTPEGDLSGIMIFARDGDTYTGYMENSQGRVDFKDVVIENGQINCNFDYNGYTVLMSGLFEANAFNGKVSVDYNDFLMTATKRE